MYEAVRRVVASINPLGKCRTTVYNMTSQNLVTIEANGNRVSSEYDVLCRGWILELREGPPSFSLCISGPAGRQNLCRGRQAPEYVQLIERPSGPTQAVQTKASESCVGPQGLGVHSH